LLSGWVTSPIHPTHLTHPTHPTHPTHRLTHSPLRCLTVSLKQFYYNFSHDFPVRGVLFVSCFYHRKVTRKTIGKLFYGNCVTTQATHPPFLLSVVIL